MEGILAVAFMPNSAYCTILLDGRWIAGRLGANDGAYQVWNSKTGKLVTTIVAHSGGVISITFSSESDRILSASHNKTFHVCTINW